MASMPFSSFRLPSNLSFLILNLNSFVTVKLDINNFIVWNNQWHNILRATSLISYIDGSIAPPLDFIKDVAGIDVLNPNLNQWQIIDAHLLSCVTNKLHSIVKASNSMEDYLLQIKAIADQLSLAGSAIDDKDLVLLTFNGLLSEYNAFKTTIRAKTNSVSTKVLSSLLCSEAIHIENATKVSSDLHVVYATSSVSQPHIKSSSHNSSSGSRGYNRGNH
ncbi:uncharacterized protein LOC114298114 [Camellia sinensis]|uniref:uncharacterized protein LOC114298114 n=1 Tax=Camellia sinensis TaxID=4442 RepID=UPI0010368144|nr:uncharacterized protein LOC114298114 [Camellia sinensis]